uniref:Uncharacterized protein n=1 Tax=Romanomermis culicivorax TaxID=13658 RepID=A0A915K2J5_ROMCU
MIPTETLPTVHDVQLIPATAYLERLILRPYYYSKSGYVDPMYRRRWPKHSAATDTRLKL